MLKRHPLGDQAPSPAMAARAALVGDGALDPQPLAFPTAEQIDAGVPALGLIDADRRLFEAIQAGVRSPADARDVFRGRIMGVLMALVPHARICNVINARGRFMRALRFVPGTGVC